MKSRLKIADVSEFYSPDGGGVKTYVNQKFETAAVHGHDLTVIAPGPAHHIERRNGGRIVWVPAPRLIVDPRYHIFTSGAHIWHALDELQPDVIEASSPWRGGWVASRWPGSAIKILFMHSDPIASYPHHWFQRLGTADRIDQLFGWFWAYLRRLSASCDSTIVGGDWLARRFQTHGLKNPLSIPLGIQKGLFDPANADLTLRASMLQECGLPPTASLLITVGRFHPEKRLPLLIEAVQRANEKRPVGLYIVGDGLSRRTVERAARKVKQVYLAGNISLRPKVAAMLSSADALIHGAGSETFGYVVAESLCAGTPVIVPDRGGAADLYNHACAEQYQTGNANSASQAILRLLSRDETALRLAAVEKAKKSVRTADEHFRALFEHYEELVTMSASKSE